MNNIGIYFLGTFKHFLLLMFLQKCSIGWNSQLVLKLFNLLLKLRFLFKLLRKRSAHHLLLVLYIFCYVFIFFHLIIQRVWWIWNANEIKVFMHEILVLLVSFLILIGAYMILFSRIHLLFTFNIIIIRILLYNFFWHLNIRFIFQKFWYYIIVNFHKIRNILLRAQITLFDYLILLICFINLLIW